MLLPAIAKAKMKAMLSVDMNNHKQLMLGMHMYSTDNSDIILGTDGNPGGGYWKGPQKNGLDSDITAGITHDEAYARVAEGYRNSQIYRYVSSVGTFHCPGDERTKMRKPGNGWAYDSYSKANGMNGWAGNPRDTWEGTTVQPPFVKWADMQKPTDSMVFIEESDSRGWNKGTWVINVGSPGWVDPFAVYHGSVTSFGFGDGHGEIHKWLVPGTITAGQNSAKGIYSFYWSGGGKSNKDFVWVWDHYQHLKWAPLK
jgi:hypothetical protein